MVNLSIHSGKGFHEVSALHPLKEAKCMTFLALASVLEKAQHECLMISPISLISLASFLENQGF